MYLMIFKCNLIQEKSLIQGGTSESPVLTVGMEEGHLLLSEQKKLLINTEQSVYRNATIGVVFL